MELFFERVSSRIRLCSIVTVATLASTASLSKKLFAKSPELRFCALLTDGAREVRFERVAAG